MSKQPPPVPTASTIGPCPTIIQIVGRPGTGSLPSTIAPPDHPPQICRTPRHWKFIQDHRTTRPPPAQLALSYYYSYYQNPRGWSDGAMVLGKLPVPGRHTNLDYSRARAYCACSRCGWGWWFGNFFSHLSFLFSFSLSQGDGPI